MSEIKQGSHPDESCGAENSMKKKDVLPVNTGSPHPNDDHRSGIIAPLTGGLDSVPVPEELWTRDSHRDSGYVPSPCSASGTSPSPGSVTPRDRHFRFDSIITSGHYRSTSCSSIKEADEDEGVDDDDDDDDDENAEDGDNNIVFDLGSVTFGEEDEAASMTHHDTHPSPSSMTVPIAIPPLTATNVQNIGPGSPADMSFTSCSPGGSPGSYSGSFMRRLRMHSTPVAGSSQGGYSYLLPPSSGLYPDNNPCGWNNRQQQQSDDTRTISTQTPSPHSQVIHHAVRWQVRQQSTPTTLPLTRTTSIARGRAVERFRLHSEGDDEDRCSEDDSFPLLPEIQGYRRDRSQSEPAVPAWQRTATERRFGRELRRISDEFHDSYIDLRQSRGRNQNIPRPSSYPGTRENGQRDERGRPFWHHIWRYFAGQQANNATPNQRSPQRTRSQSTSELS